MRIRSLLVALGLALLPVSATALTPQGEVFTPDFTPAQIEAGVPEVAPHWQTFRIDPGNITFKYMDVWLQAVGLREQFNELPPTSWMVNLPDNVDVRYDVSVLADGETRVPAWKAGTIVTLPVPGPQGWDTLPDVGGRNNLGAADSTPPTTGGVSASEAQQWLGQIEDLLRQQAEIFDQRLAAQDSAIANEADARARVDAALAERLDGIAGELEALRDTAGGPSVDPARLDRLETRLDGLIDQIPDTGPLLSALSTLQATVNTLQERGPAAVDVSRIRAEVQDALAGLPAEVQALRRDLDELSDQVAVLDGRVVSQGEQIAAQGERLDTIDSTVGDATATADEALAQADAAQSDATAALTQVSELTKEGGAIPLLQDQLNDLTAESGPLADLRGELTALTKDGGRLAAVEGQLVALNAEGGAIPTLQQQLDDLVAQDGVVDQRVAAAVQAATAEYDERLARAENPFRSALVTVVPAAADWSSARQTVALIIFGAIVALVLVILTTLVARLVTRTQRAQSTANHRLLHGYTEQLGTWWARLRGKANVIHHQGLKATVDNHADRLKEVEARLDNPETGLTAVGEMATAAHETASVALATGSSLALVDVSGDPKTVQTDETITCWVTSNDGAEGQIVLTKTDAGTFDTTMPRAIDQSALVVNKSFRSKQAIINWLHSCYANGKGPLASHLKKDPVPPFIPRHSGAAANTEFEPA